MASESEFENVMCAICLKMAFKAQKMGCGHLVCSECVENWRKTMEAPMIAKGMGKEERDKEMKEKEEREKEKMASGVMGKGGKKKPQKWMLKIACPMCKTQNEEMGTKNEDENSRRCEETLLRDMKDVSGEIDPEIQKLVSKSGTDLSKRKSLAQIKITKSDASTSQSGNDQKYLTLEKESVPNCEEHDQFAEFYCVTCNRSVCGTCAADGEHKTIKGHKVISRVEAVELLSDRGESVAQQIGLLLEVFKKGRFEDMVKFQDKILDSVVKAYSRAGSRFEEEKAEKERELTKLFNDDNANLEERKECVSSIIKESESLLEGLDFATKSKSITFLKCAINSIAEYAKLLSRVGKNIFLTNKYRVEFNPVQKNATSGLCTVTVDHPKQVPIKEGTFVKAHRKLETNELVFLHMLNQWSFNNIPDAAEYMSRNINRQDVNLLLHLSLLVSETSDELSTILPKMKTLERIRNLSDSNKKKVGAFVTEFLVANPESAELQMLMYEYEKEIENKDPRKELVETSAKNGSAEAQYILGCRYRDGKGVEENLKKAIKWLEKAKRSGRKCDGELGECQYTLGCRYRDGKELPKGMDQSFEIAVEVIELFEKAKSNGKECEDVLSECQYALGCHYRDGEGLPKDVNQSFENAVEWFKKAKSNGKKCRDEIIACEDGIKAEKGNVTEEDGGGAVDLYEKSDEFGDPEAQYRLGDYYYYGKGVQQNSAKAFEWYSKAINHGNEDAQYAIGLCYMNGKGVEQDFEEAIETFEKVDKKKSCKEEIATCQLGIKADEGDDEAQYLLGNCYCDGKGIEQDFEKAFECYSKSAESGNSKAQYALGECYRDGKGVEQDFEKAFGCYLKSAETGNDEIQYVIGCCYRDGKGVEEDFEKALDWFEKAKNSGRKCGAEIDFCKCGIEAKLGDKDAQKCLGNHYYFARGVEQDCKKSVEWHLKAAAQGNMKAQSNLGNSYYYGKGVEQDYKKSVEWHLKAAAQGSPNSQYMLGECYANGYGVPRDYEKAFKFYSKSAKQGNVNAQYKLGACYYYGRGTSQNYEKAIKWYEKVSASGNNCSKEIAACNYATLASQGFLHAQFNLGKCYYNGEGVEKDMQKAFKWLNESAEHGHGGSQYQLGWCYYNGEGVEKDKEKSRYWFEKSAAQGDARSQSVIKYYF